MKPAIYEGDEAYIFVSYAHKDSEAVFDVLNELQAQGYRLWYDDGIAPGSEWPEDIARHLDAAEVVFAFITPNSMASPNCRREINFSLSRGKPFLAIYLEKTDMSLGMQMQLSAQQSVKRYNFETREGFIDRILKCQEIVKCREEQKPATETALTPEPKPDSHLPSADSYQPASNSEASLGSASIDLLEELAPIAPLSNDISSQMSKTNSEKTTSNGKAEVSRLEPKEKSESAATVGGAQPNQSKIDTVTPIVSPTAEKRPLKIGKIISLVAAAAVVVAVAIFAIGIMNATRTIVTSWGSEIEVDSTYVTARDRIITQDDLDSIASLDSLNDLELVNCDLSECDLSNLSFTSTDLATINLSGSTGITDFGFLSNLPLRHLYLEGQGSFDDLSIVNTETLTELNIGGTSVKNLDALENAPLYKLVFRGTAISDLSPAATMVDLQMIDGAYSQVTSLDPILGLEELESISFSGCKIDYPDSPLAALSLSEAYLADTGLKNLSIIADCTVLKTLNISRNDNIAAIELDTKNYASLENLNVAHTPLEADDLSFVSQCSNLQTLVLDGCSLHNLKCCDGLGALTYLSAINCGLDNIDDLAGCTMLESVYLSCNNIEDISALSNLDTTENRPYSSEDIVLELTFNDIKNVACLPAYKYRAIMLYGNAENIATTLPNGVEASQFVLPWCKGLGDSELANQSSYPTIYLVDCPQNEVLETQDALDNEKLITKEDLRELYANNNFDLKLDFDTEYFLSVASF